MLEFLLFAKNSNYQGDAKSTPSYPLDLHLSVIKCNCQTYDDNISPK